MHVGEHLRAPFLSLVEEHSVEVRDLPPNTLIEGVHRGQDLTWERLLGLLWHSTDTAPADCCETLEFPQGSTFAQIVQNMKCSQR